MNPEHLEMAKIRRLLTQEERALLGLKCCVRMDCLHCPYAPCTSYRCTCKEMLYEAAAVLLPRVLSDVELESRYTPGSYTTAILETREEKPVEIVLRRRRNQGKPRYCILEIQQRKGIQQRNEELCAEEYGVTWRLWSRIPTERIRAAEPWKEVQEEDGQEGD